MSQAHKYIFRMAQYYKVTVGAKEEINRETISGTKFQLKDKFCDFIERHIMGDIVVVEGISAVDLIVSAMVYAVKVDPDWFSTVLFDYWLSKLGLINEKEIVKDFLFTVWGRGE